MYAEETVSDAQTVPLNRLPTSQQRPLNTLDTTHPVRA